MGQEISDGRFRRQDFLRFAHRLEEETTRLQQDIDEQRLSRRHGIGGFELEAWLVDRNGQPAPINERYLALLGDGGLYSPELSQFNVELNSTPLPLDGNALSRMHAELTANWQHCRQVAQMLDAELVMIGILPTVSPRMLTLEHMSHMTRYRALNEQVLRLRQGRPLELDIVGEQHLQALHGDVMLEAATTSFQLHLQVAQGKAVRYYNAMQILSAPLVAICANSPLLFGKRLWQETRIPLFEQAVSIGGIAGASAGPLRRVSFGSGYARNSLMEVFQENLEHFPVLLPVDLENSPESLGHLRLHNGTIWRWNRPLVGFDADGAPHLRIEHRVLPAGPSVLDSIANAALFYGLSCFFAERSEAPEQQLGFAQARDNFYAAARFGLNASITWLDGEHIRIGKLLAQLLPLAMDGLRTLGCDREVSEYYLSIIDQRLQSGQTGAAWQLSWLDKYGDDSAALVEAYLEHQNSGLAVHEWTL